MACLRTRGGSMKVFLLSGIGDSVRKDLARKIHLLGGKYFDLQDFKAMCTHVVCGRLSRSEKFLGACATGKWVLHPDYVHDSYIAGCWLDEEQYEWCDDHIAQKYQVDECLALAARRWRFLLGDVTAAFTGWKVAVIAGAKKAKVIKRLLISGGAEIYNLRIPVRNPGKVADTIGYIFVSEHNMKSVIHLIDYGVLCIKPEFIGDFLIKDPQPDPMDYLVQVNSLEELPAGVAEPESQDSFLIGSQRSMYLSPEKPGISDFTPSPSRTSSPVSVRTPCSTLASNLEKPKDKLLAHGLKSQRSFTKDAPISKLVNDVTDQIMNAEEPGPSLPNDIKADSLANIEAANTKDIRHPNNEIIDLIDSPDETIETIEYIDRDVALKSESAENVDPASQNDVNSSGKIRKSKRYLVKKSPAWKSLIPGTRAPVQPLMIKQEDTTADKSSDSLRSRSPVVKKESTVKRNLLESMGANSALTSTPAKTPTTKKHLLKASLNMSPITKFFKRIEPVPEEKDDPVNKSNLTNSAALTSSQLNKSDVKTTTTAAASGEKNGLVKRKTTTVTKEKESNIKKKIEHGDKQGVKTAVEVRTVVSENIENEVETIGQHENENKIELSENSQNENKKVKAWNKQNKCNQDLSKNKESEMKLDKSRSKLNENQTDKSVGKQKVNGKGDRKRKSTEIDEADCAINGTSDCKRVTRSSPGKNEPMLLSRSSERSPNIDDFTTIFVSPSKKVKTVTDNQPESDQVTSATDLMNTNNRRLTSSKNIGNNVIDDSCTSGGGKRKHDYHLDLQEVLTDIKRRKIGMCEWRATSFVFNLRETEDVPESVCMGTTATEIFLATLEDGFVLESLKYLRSQVTFKYYPQSKVISEVIRNVLLTAEQEIIANMSYTILSQMLMLHPPITASLQEVYLRALAGCPVGEDWQVGAEWNFIQQCFSNLLTSDDVVVRRNNRLLFRFILQLLQHNIQHFQSTAFSQEDNDTRHMLLRIIWSPSYHVVFNKRCRALIDVMSDIIQSYKTKHCDTEKKHLMEMLEGVLWMITMVTECCRVLECGNTDLIRALQADKTSAFVHEISRKLIDLDVRESVLLENIFNGLQLPWLRVGVCQQLLNIFDDYLLTEENLKDTRSLSLLLILTKYVYLLPIFDVLPRTSGSHSPDKTRTKQINKIHMTSPAGKYLTENTDMNKENIDKITLRANKKNHKGETQLHVACIRNDVTAVKKLLKIPGINVNATDNVGWTPLHEASNHGNTECVIELLKFIPSKTVDVFFTKDNTNCRKVDLMASNGEGITPLHDAVLNNKLDVCHLLLQHGGPKLLETQTCLGYTPVDLAETDDMRTVLCSYSHVRRKHNDSHTLIGSQESTSSEDDNIVSAPSEELYQEVTYIDGERVYANIKSTIHYIQLVTLLVKNYFSFRNLHVVCQFMKDKRQSYNLNVGDNEQKSHQFGSYENNDSVGRGNNSVDDSSSCQNNQKCTGLSIQTLDTVCHMFGKSRSSLIHNGHTDRERRHVMLEPTVNSEEVANILNELKVVRKIPHYINLFRSHLMQICRPEDSPLINQELQELFFLTEDLLH